MRRAARRPLLQRRDIVGAGLSGRKMNHPAVGLVLQRRQIALLCHRTAVPFGAALISRRSFGETRTETLYDFAAEAPAAMRHRELQFDLDHPLRDIVLAGELP